MFVLRFTRRGVERRFLAADKGGASGGGASPKPALAGITQKERAAAQKNERPLSAENASIIPGMDDILGSMRGVSEFLPKAEAEEAAEESESEEETETEEETEEAEETTEESEEESETEEETEEATEESEEEEAGETTEESEEESEIQGLVDEAGKKIELPPAAQKALNKRFAKLTRQKHEAREKAQAAEARATELQTQLDQAQAGPVRIAPDAEQPLADVGTPAELQARIARAREIEDWALRHPDGAEIVIDDKGTKQFVEKEVVANHLANARQILNAAPAREQYLQMNANADRIAKAAYPKMFTTGTPENQQFQRVKAALPQLMRFPDYQLIIADAMAGKVARESKGKSATEAAALLKKKPIAKVHAGPAAKPAPKVAARVVQTRGVTQAAVEGLGSKASVLAFAENLVGAR